MVIEALEVSTGSTKTWDANTKSGAKATTKNGAGNARGKTYNAKNSVEIGNRYKLGISDNKPYIAPVPVKKPVSSSSLKSTQNYSQKGLKPCYNCSDSYERDPVYFEPWHQKFEAPSIDNAPHRSGNIYTPKTFE